MPDADDYIRRLRLPDHAKNGVVHWRGFKASPRDKGAGISVTRCGEKLLTAEQINVYREKNTPQGEGLIGLCFVKPSDITNAGCEGIDAPITEDRDYGELHRLIRAPDDPDLCPNKDQCDKLAVAATNNGGVISPDVL